MSKTPSRAWIATRIATHRSFIHKMHWYCDCDLLGALRKCLQHESISSVEPPFWSRRRALKRSGPGEMFQSTTCTTPVGIGLSPSTPQYYTSLEILPLPCILTTSPLSLAHFYASSKFARWKRSSFSELFLRNLRSRKAQISEICFTVFIPWGCEPVKWIHKSPKYLNGSFLKRNV